MWRFVDAATGLPGILFTAAVVVAGGFWLLAACGLVPADAFDADADLAAWGMGGASATVALSLLSALAWLFNTGLTVVLDAALPGAAADVLRLPAAAAAVLAARLLTPVFVRRPHEPTAPAAATDPPHGRPRPGRAAGRQEPT
ncbi:hypothetical protein ACGFS9_08460 [Streptomyces sp. NPDC048566]|uniref:hypothetical protein n=1 Tax=Streptomyces sp. NPDC048566 TaxID=3365569 RepID=UPI00370F8B56